MRFGDFHTLTFDVVGTLIDFETGILEWFRPALRQRGVSKTDGELLTTFAAVEDGYQTTPPAWPTLPVGCERNNDLREPRVHEPLERGR